MSIWKKATKKMKIFIVMGSLSFIFILLGVKFSNNFFGVAIGTVGTILFSNIMLEIINKNIENNDYIDKMCTCIESEVKAIKIGIQKIDIQEERYITPDKIIKEAKEKIDIVHVYGDTWTKNNSKEFISILKNEYVKVRVIMADVEDNILMEAYNHAYNTDFRKAIVETLKLWNDIYEKAGQKNNLEIRLFNGLICHAIHLNEKYVVTKSISNTKSKFDGMTTTIFAEKVDNGIYYNLFNEIKELVDESRLITFEKIRNLVNN